MEKLKIRYVTRCTIRCPANSYCEEELKVCYGCHYFRGLEYIDDGFKNLVCGYRMSIDEKGENT
jgi:hypothetical protein